MAGTLTFICWVVFNVAIVIPSAVLLFYTVNSVFPVLAAVEDQDALVYERLNLDQMVDEESGEPTVPRHKADADSRPVSSSIRSMMRLLYSSRKCFSLCRGFGWLLLWNMAKALVLVIAYKLGSTLGFMAQILLPLPIVQIHILWVHKIIASRNPNPFSQRLIPARQAFKAVALPMFVLLVAEAITQRVLLHAYISMEMKWEYFFPIGLKMDKAFQFWLLLAVVTFFLIVPAHLLLVRVEASLLPAGERTVVPVDPALSSDRYARGYMTVIEAWKSLTRASLANLIFLYLRIFFVTAAVVGVLGAIDFMWYIVIAMASWRF